MRDQLRLGLDILIENRNLSPIEKALLHKVSPAIRLV